MATARLFRDKGDVESALADFAAALRLNPRSYRDYYARGRMFADQRDYVRALADGLADCDASRKLRPDNADTLDSRAFAHLKLGDLEAGHRDIAAAKMLKADIAEELARYGFASVD